MKYGAAFTPRPVENMVSWHLVPPYFVFIGAGTIVTAPGCALSPTEITQTKRLAVGINQIIAAIDRRNNKVFLFNRMKVIHANRKKMSEVYIIFYLYAN